VLGVVAVAVRRPRRTTALVAVTAGALLSVGINAAGLPADLHFVVPVAPAFVLLGLGGLLGARAYPGSPNGATPTSGS